jgi:hypothetical protein
VLAPRLVRPDHLGGVPSTEHACKHQLSIVPERLDTTATPAFARIPRRGTNHAPAGSVRAMK